MDKRKLERLRRQPGRIGARNNDRSVLFGASQALRSPHLSSVESFVGMIWTSAESVLDGFLVIARRMDHRPFAANWLARHDRSEPMCSESAIFFIGSCRFVVRFLSSSRCVFC